MDKPIIILGSGGHAKVVADTLKLLGKQVLGFVTNNDDSLKKILDINILEQLELYNPHITKEEQLLMK